MRFPTPEFDDAVAAVCHGTADAACLESLGKLLAESDAALDAYLRRTELHAALLTSPDFAVPVDVLPVAVGDGRQPQGGPLAVGEYATLPSPLGVGRAWAVMGGIAAVITLLAASFIAATAGKNEDGHKRPAASDGPPVAVALPARIGAFTDLDSIVWVKADTRVEHGDPVREGDRVELASGSLRIDLDNGVKVKLTGPAIFEIESQLSAVLTMGRVQVTADTPESKGFEVRTRTGRIVDLGTEFIAEALPDGRCRIGVTNGEVRFHLANSADGQLLRAGDLMEVEPGIRQAVTRIERGDESPAFVFPTIEPPSIDDFADASRGLAVVRRVKGRLYENTRKQIFSGAPEILLDGRGQSNADCPAESVYFLDGDEGRLHLDLGADVPLKKVNVFSWHLCLNPGFPSDLRVAHRERAAQNYVLYASSADDAPEAGDDPAATGWTLIARVNSDEYFGLTGIKRPAQQASSITSARGSLGTFRHLLFVVQPTKGVNHDGMEHDFGTFFGEIDVYAN